MTERTGPKISSRGDPHAGRDAVEHARADQEAVALRARGPAVEGDLGALLLADVEVAGDAVEVLAGDDRAHVDLGAAVGRARPSSGPRGRRAARPAARPTLPTGTATLPAMHRSPAQPKAESLERRGGLVEVGVGHDDQVVLRPAGRLDPLAVPRAGLVDVPGHRGRADERDRAHQRVRQQRHRRTRGRRARC